MSLAALALVPPVLLAAWYGAPLACRARESRALQRRCSETRTLVLTYDDGPGPRLTRELLALLASRRAAATFFMLGMHAAQHPDVVDAVCAAGHEVACHGHAHLNAWRCTPWRGLRDLREGYQQLAPWLHDRGLYRPPYGKATILTRAAVHRRRGQFGWWTIVAGDVERRLPDVTRAADALERRDGGVVLLHDFDRQTPRATFVLDATEALLNAAQRRSLRVVTLGQLLRLPRSSAAVPATASFQPGSETLPSGS